MEWNELKNFICFTWIPGETVKVLKVVYADILSNQAAIAVVNT